MCNWLELWGILQHNGLTNVQVYLETFDQLDDPCNSEQPKQLLNAQQLTDLYNCMLV